MFLWETCEILFWVDQTYTRTTYSISAYSDQSKNSCALTLKDSNVSWNVLLIRIAIYISYSILHFNYHLAFCHLHIFHETQKKKLKLQIFPLRLSIFDEIGTYHKIFSHPIKSKWMSQIVRFEVYLRCKKSWNLPNQISMILAYKNMITRYVHGRRAESYCVRFWFCVIMILAQLI